MVSTDNFKFCAVLVAQGICATGFKCAQGNAQNFKITLGNRMTFEYAPNMMIVKVHPHSSMYHFIIISQSDYQQIWNIVEDIKMVFQNIYLGDMHHFFSNQNLVAKAHSLMCPGSCDGIMHRKKLCYKQYTPNMASSDWHIELDTQESANKYVLKRQINSGFCSFFAKFLSTYF